MSGFSLTARARILSGKVAILQGSAVDEQKTMKVPSVEPQLSLFDARYER